MKETLPVVLTALALVIGLASVDAQSGGSHDIAFPIITENLKNKNADGRNPMYAPTRCPEDQLLYPGDQPNDWQCDCAPGFIYHPATDKCYYAYRRGPCNEGHYLVLPPRESVPKCLTNPCKEDGMVRFQEQCWKLERPGGPCPRIEEEGGGILGINATTMQPACLHRYFPLLHEIKQQRNMKTKSRKRREHSDSKSSSRSNCQGNLRYLNGKCRKILLQ